MAFTRLHLKKFRLFNDELFKFTEGVNLILGKNGSGKTSLLESMEILFNGISFRSRDTKDCIKEGFESFSISAKGTLKDKEYLLQVKNSQNSKISASRKLLDKSVKKGELVFLQLVLAKNLKMIEGEPELRREHLNQIMFHVEPSLKRLENKYQKALKQRNRCLKKNLPNSEIALWTSEVADLGLELSLKQYHFFKIYRESLKNFINEVTDRGIFEFLKGMDISFSKGWERSNKLKTSLLESLDRDRALGYTSKGPHRMDFTYTLNKKNAANQLSRGQSKILILLSFLSNLILLEHLKGSETLLLIDDLSSELDQENLAQILKEILEIKSQIILTGIEGTDMHASIKNLSNFTQINL